MPGNRQPSQTSASSRRKPGQCYLSQKFSRRLGDPGNPPKRETCGRGGIRVSWCRNLLLFDEFRRKAKPPKPGQGHLARTARPAERTMVDGFLSGGRNPIVAQRKSERIRR